MATIAYQAPPPKRPAGVAGLEGKTIRPVKRRASKACQCCRSRKVRCNVIEHGAPCTNCRLDEVPCIVTESKRKRKSMANAPNGISTTHNDGAARHHSDPAFYVSGDNNHQKNNTAGESPKSTGSIPSQSSDHHVPHTLYANHAAVPAPGTTSLSILSNSNNSNASVNGSGSYNPQLFPQPQVTPRLPYFIRPLPSRIGPDETAFLLKKNALMVPDAELRNELLKCYVEFVHPYMPILNLEETLQIVDRDDGTLGRVSLLLFQAMMFAASPMVDTVHLKRAGYGSRREARKAMYQKVRLLYDFDYETDRVALLQTLLLMTSWYESPDDQKDTWHWMGNAISLAHTIGLNRDPTQSSMEAPKQKQWRRMWWTCIVRDRLIALGMRRPTRIKSEDHNVPMLTVDDFDLKPLSDDILCIPASCKAARDVETQRVFALMCIEKAKLCLVVSHVLQAQYSLPEQPSGAMGDLQRQTSALVPKNTSIKEVETCQQELQRWLDNLPAEVQLQLPMKTSRDRNLAPIILNRAILHMVYFTTLSALHRPQVLAETRFSTTPAETLANAARDRVRAAANSITTIACGLLEADIVRFLPTSGVTVLQPAIISHLLDIKEASEDVQTSGLQGFCQCVQVMSRMRSVYAAADYSLALIEAAVRKADINIPGLPHELYPRKASGTEDLIDAGLRRKLVRPIPEPRPLTPPPESHSAMNGVETNATPRPTTAGTESTDGDVARRLGLFLASTPPQSDSSSTWHNGGGAGINGMLQTPMPDLDREFESLINLDDFGDAYTFNAGGLTSLQGESSGFTFDMDWLHASANGGLISRPKSGMSMFGGINGLDQIDEDDEKSEVGGLGIGDVKIPV